MAKRKTIRTIKVIVLIILIIAVLTMGALAATYFGLLAKGEKINKQDMPKAYGEEVSHTNSIHFLELTFGDCIILESEGHIAIIDSGEDSDNPRNFPTLAYEGNEENIVNYLKRYFGDENGKVNIDFIVGTHAHSDHLGGFDTIILDEDITIGRAYLKRYLPDTIAVDEVIKWDNQEVYDQMVNALATRNIPLIQDLNSEPFYMGSFKITLLNTKEHYSANLTENDNSLAVLVEYGTQKALLMGDVNKDTGDEREIARQVGEVDLLKAGHHGNRYSSTFAFVTKVKPSKTIITNAFANAYKPSLVYLYGVGSSAYSCFDMHGIIAVFEDGKEITLYSGIM